MSHPNSNLTRFTGYRLRFDNPRAVAHRWANLRKVVENLMPIYELAANEPFFIDDALKQYPPLELTMMALRDGELFQCVWDGELVGIVVISEILHERSAKINAYALPQWRTSYAARKAMHTQIKEIIEYCFKPFANDPAKPSGDGLGLQKLKAEVCADNHSSLKACRALRFEYIGTSKLDVLFNGEPRDTVLLELLNPEFFTNAVSQLSQSTELHTALAVPGPVIHSPGSPERPRRIDGPASDAASSTNGEDAPPVAANRRKSNGPRRAKRIRG